MIDEAILIIDAMVENVYMMQFKKISTQYIELLDKISILLEKFAEKGYQIDLLQELNELHSVFEKKDYIELADCLLYELKQDMIELKKLNEI